RRLKLRDRVQFFQCRCERVGQTPDCPRPKFLVLRRFARSIITAVWFETLPSSRFPARNPENDRELIWSLSKRARSQRWVPEGRRTLSFRRMEPWAGPLTLPTP